MPQEISLTIPLGQAIDRTKRLLFRPFDPAKWFIIGFCAWLAQLGEGGFSFGGNYKGGFGKGNLPNLQQYFDQGRSYVLSNLGWIIPVAATLVLLAIALWLAVLWLNSRGQFMFLHCVALEKAEIRIPWRQYAREANSLFLFRLVLTIVSMVLTLPFVAGIVFVVIAMVRGGTATAVGIAGLAALVLLSLGFVLVWVVLVKLTRDFVVPIQFTRGCGCREAWGILFGLLSRNIGEFILYLLFQIVLTIAVFAIIMTIIVVTCCLAGCVLAIPYIGTVLLLPILIFQRSYSIHYLAQYGAEYFR